MIIKPYSVSRLQMTLRNLTFSALMMNLLWIQFEQTFTGFLLDDPSCIIIYTMSFFL